MIQLLSNSVLNTYLLLALGLFAACALLWLVRRLRCLPAETRDALAAEAEAMVAEAHATRVSAVESELRAALHRAETAEARAELAEERLRIVRKHAQAERDLRARLHSLTPPPAPVEGAPAHERA